MGQRLETLKRGMERPTVVTAYYPIKSKFPSERYIHWISQFWPATDCPLVFFCPPEVAGPLEQLLRGRGGPTKVWPLPFSELAAFKRLCPALWLSSWLQDPEKDIHTPELYAIWFEKKEFMRRVIEANPFGSETFVWCDAGICRFPEWVPALRSFPRAERIPRGRMLALQIQPFEAEDRLAGFTGNRIGGGILASDAAGWSAWYKAYDAMFMQMYLDGHFIGKDQTIMGSCILADTQIAQLVQPLERLTPVQKWFSLLFYLAAPHAA
jgi:hypothetical protein